jgi:hypothetical protein
VTEGAAHCMAAGAEKTGRQVLGLPLKGNWRHQ